MVCMRTWVVLVALCVLVGCAHSDPACVTMQQRARVIATWCQSMLVRVGQQQCAGLDPADADACMQLVLATAGPACMEQAGASMVAWAQQEFCQ